MVRIVLSGCNGKMGQVITRLCEAAEDVTIVAGVDINTRQMSTYPVLASAAEFTGEADVIIDFSHPSSLSPLLEMAVARQIPAVICTTGLSAEQKQQLRETSQKVGIFFSANMSLGINVLIDLLKRAAVVLQDNYDIEIVERHHNQKIDAPSGTALALADAISQVLRYEPEYVYDRHSVRKKREKQEIGLHAVRGGNIVGDHEVIFAGTNEVIELRHSAASREVFAEGAVKAACFMAGKPAGLYDMADLVASYQQN
ncbi:MAG: 4-hydroxy-tetrahydrodipicolinate reductase [Eubacteriales bacterium]|jgi:4-hydroxy-tetrahydrodipicolinate reductase